MNVRDSIITFSALIGALCYIAYLKGEENKAEIIIKNLKEKNQQYVQKEQRLVCMQKTIEITYNLSSYEAHYYSIIFDDFSQKYKVPWEAYPALVRIESNFNSGVMSKNRAKGMTQVLENTGKAQAEKLGITYNDGTLWNCLLNMIIGFDYFSEGYIEKKDSLSKNNALKHAMKRYCGGPNYAIARQDAKAYVKEYKSSLWDEYIRVSYIYKGVLFDFCNLDSLKKGY